MSKEQYLHLSGKVTVAVSDADFTGRIKPSAVMEYFQDIATEHADMIGVGYAAMMAKNLVWVMTRMSFEVLKSPKIGEELTIKTFPEKPNNADVNRGYYAYNADGELIMSGTSRWCALSADTHAVRRCMPLFSFEDSAYIPGHPLQDANPKIASAFELSETLPEKTFSYTVAVTDLDRNVHMNNARYGDIILNACGAETVKTHRAARVDINFMSELLAGERCAVFKAQKDGETYLEAKKDGTDAVVFRARVVWERV